MKCPNCGFWNKAQFPKCFQCGHPLDGSPVAFGTEIIETEELRADYAETTGGQTGAYMSMPAPSYSEELYIDVAGIGEESAEFDFDEYYPPQDLSQQNTRQVQQAQQGTMNYDLPTRVIRQEPGTIDGTNRYAGAQRNAGRATPPANVVPFVSASELERDFPVRPAPLPTYGKPIEVLEHENIYVRPLEPEAAERKTRHGRIATRKFRDEPGGRKAKPATPPVTKKSEIKPIYAMKDNRRKRMALKAFFRIAMIIALLAAIGIGIYLIAPKISSFFKAPEQDATQRASADADFRIEQIEKNERTAHEIVFRSDIYESVYIQELKNTYLFTAGEVSVLLYDDVVIGDAPEYENMSVNFTPVFYHPSGRQDIGNVISYELLIPPTSIELVQPATDYLSVQTSITPIKFKVPKGSRVTVNGDDVSDFADSNGYVLQNIDTSQFGDITIEIVAQAMGRTKTTKTVTFNRPYMDILIELASTVSGSSSSKTVELRGTTAPGATITLDTTQVGDGVVESDGSFAIKAQMTKIGLNEVIIRASMPGKEDSLYTLSVDYAPKLDEYSKSAWPISAQNYGDLVGYSANKVGKIYVGTGLVTYASSDSPAVYSVEMDGGMQTLIRMVEGKSLELNKRYKIYCDFDSMENGLPLFIGRYYYDQTPTP